MKKRLTFPRSVVLIASAFLLFSSCSRKEGCTDLRAENYDPSAEKDNGECILPREKFIGFYTGLSLCSNPIGGQFESTVTKANDNLSDIFIENLGGFVEAKVRATIIGNTLTIKEQDPAANGKYVSGNGNIIGNLVNIQISYVLGDGINTASCQIEMQK
jgi:hypothetical protein